MLDYCIFNLFKIYLLHLFKYGLKRMKKLLFFIIFTIVSSGFSGEMKAQTARTIASQRTDDGVLVAYPNPTKDVLLLKSKDISVKIKTVTFFSILGAQVAEYIINSNNTELRLDKLRPGKYLMRYTLDDNTRAMIAICKHYGIFNDSEDL